MDNERNDILQTKRQEIIDLQCNLESCHSPIGDWKLNKQQEAILMGETAPYTNKQMQEYHVARQAARARINELQAEIAALETEE